MASTAFEPPPANVAAVLSNEAARRWSGLLRVVDGGEAVGTIVLRQGVVVWATAKGQQEDLAGALRRAGVVDEALQGEVRARFQTVGRLGRLASLLEQRAGLDRGSFHHLLCRHLRSVLGLLVHRPASTVFSAKERVEVDPDLGCTWDELFVEAPSGATLRPPSPPRRPTPVIDGLTWDDAEPDEPAEVPATAGGAREELKRQVAGELARLSESDGFRGAIAMTSAGEVLVATGFSSDQEVAELSASLTAILLGYREAERRGGIGPARAIRVDSDDGALLFRWLGRERGWVLVVALDPTGHPGGAKRGLEEAALRLTPLLAGAGADR